MRRVKRVSHTPKQGNEKYSEQTSDEIYITTSQGLTHVTKKNKRTVKKTPKLQDHMTNNAQDKRKKNHI